MTTTTRPVEARSRPSGDSSAEALPRAKQLPRWTGDVFGLAWVLVAAAALMGRTLLHGVYLGPMDWLSGFGLAAQPGVVVHNRQLYDQVTEMIPWTQLAWTQVHQGHLPLWNPYSALGTPLAFNFQTATFSVPLLIGYLFPMHLAYTVEVLLTVVIAGSGTYVLGRVLGLGVLASAVAATAFELSGPLVGWLGWPLGSVAAWAGWLFAAAVLVLRARHRRRAVVLFAVVVACMVYAGQPEADILFAAGLAVFVVVVLALRSPPFGGQGPVRAPIVDFLCGGVAGLALSAPLLLPGVQLARHAVRVGKNAARPFPVHELIQFLVQGFYGLPIAGSKLFGNMPWYRHARAYVGVVVLVLAALGVAMALRSRRQRDERTAFVAVALVGLGVSFVGVVTDLADHLPTVEPVRWERSVLVVGFALAVLAGIGADAVVRRWDNPTVRRWVLGGFGVMAVVLLAVWGVSRSGLNSFDASLRTRSFLYPALGTAVGGIVVLVAARWRRRPSAAGKNMGTAVAMCLLVIETVLLAVAGSVNASSSPTPLAPTAAETELAHVVGGSLVGLGADTCFTTGQLGIIPNVNIAFGVHELAAYDPFLPEAYYTSWRESTGTTGGPRKVPNVPFSLFCPGVKSATVARRYGVGYILEAAGTTGPPGTVFVTTIGGEGLYRVPGSARATLVSLTGPKTSSLDAPGAPVEVSSPSPATWRMTTDSDVAGLLRLRLTDVPGWHATVDGRAVQLKPFAKVMLQVKVPPGHHVVVLHYQPAAFRVGVVVAVVALLVLVGTLLVPGLGRRRTAHRPGRHRPSRPAGTQAAGHQLSSTGPGRPAGAQAAGHQLPQS